MVADQILVMQTIAELFVCECVELALTAAVKTFEFEFYNSLSRVVCAMDFGVEPDCYVTNNRVSLTHGSLISPAKM